MDWTAIIVGAMAALGTGLGSLYGIKRSNDIISYRMDVLERKVDLHNNAVERLYTVEKTIERYDEKFKVANHRIDDLEAEK